MADDKITMTVEAMSRTMGNAVLRERRRCAQMLADQRDIERGQGKEEVALTLDKLREAMLMPATAQIVPTPQAAPGEPVVAGDEIIDDGLPPHREHDDIDEGLALVRSRSSFGRAPANSGLPTD